MNSTVREYKYPNGEIQKVQFVTLDDWNNLNFSYLETTKESFQNLVEIYRKYIVPKAPFIFGTLIIFHIPKDFELPFSIEGIIDKNLACRFYLEKNYEKREAKDFMNTLHNMGYLEIVKGKRLFHKTFMPYGDLIGFLSEKEVETSLKVNANFFTFDVFDVDSPYDLFGTPIGLLVKDGKVIQAPLFHREAFLIYQDGKVEIRKIDLNDLKCSISGKIYQRPESLYTPKTHGRDVIIVGNTVVAIKEKGRTRIPSSGFVIQTEENVHVGDIVSFSNLEDVLFGIQVGNSIMKDGKKVTSFISPFMNIFHLGSVKYPPSLYPLNFEKDRAPRIALAETNDHKPTVIWAEGKSKLKYQKGMDSCGVSLLEFANILEENNIRNAINLDGGGSAQILLKNKRFLKISGRTDENLEEERPIPLGIFVK